MSVLLTAATALSSLNIAPSTFGVDTTSHWRPFQCSANVPDPDRPTAHASVAETAATESSWFEDASGFGLDTIVKPGTGAGAGVGDGLELEVGDGVGRSFALEPGTPRAAAATGV